MFSASDPQRQIFGQIFRDSLVRSLDASHVETGTAKGLKRQKASTLNVRVDATFDSACDNTDDVSRGKQRGIPDPVTKSQNQHVGDPKRAKRKGAQKDRRQKCGLCKYVVEVFFFYLFSLCNNMILLAYMILLHIIRIAGHKRGSCPQNPINQGNGGSNSNQPNGGDDNEDFFQDNPED